MIRTEKMDNTIGYFAMYVALGMATATLGPTLPGLADNTRTALSEISFLFTAHSFGYLTGSFLSGRLYDRLPGHPVMAAAVVVMAFMMAAVPLIPYLWLLALIMLILGISGGTMDVGGNVLIVWVHGRKVGPYMNGLHFFFGVGSFLAPIAVALSLSLSHDITWAYWALAIGILPLAFAVIRLRSPRAAIPSADDSRPTTNQSNIMSDRNERMLVFLLSALLFLCVGAEVSFGGWIYTYAVSLNLATDTVAAYLTSIFWGALTLGRLFSIPIALRIRPRSILLADLTGCLLSLGLLLLWPASWLVTWTGAIGLGLSMASIFPTVISWAERRIRITGRTTGWFLVGSSAGSMFLPWLIGQVFESIGPPVTMLLILISMATALLVFITVMQFSQRRLSI